MYGMSSPPLSHHEHTLHLSIGPATHYEMIQRVDRGEHTPDPTTMAIIDYQINQDRPSPSTLDTFTCDRDWY